MSAERLAPEQLQELRDDLESLREELQMQLKRAEDDSKPVSLENPIGRLSRMDAIQQQQMAKASRANNKRRLTLVTAALQRATESDYGHCLRCDEPIGFRRLKARPESALCLECQQQREG